MSVEEISDFRNSNEIENQTPREIGSVMDSERGVSKLQG